jgi:hypothetical protein
MLFMRRRPLTLLSVPAVLAALLLAAGCGGTSNPTAGTTTAAGQATTGAAGGGFRRVANTKFTACLKSQGVTLPSGGLFRRRSGTGAPTGGAPGGAFSNPKTRSAFQACRQFLPNGGQFNRGANGGRPGVNSAAFAKYRQCLTAHGVKLTGGGVFGGANVASPAFQAAAKACRASAPPASATG